jgi:hypothetical protein
MSVVLNVSDIQLFYAKGEGRAKNDKNNKIRECILEDIITSPIIDTFISDAEHGTKWNNLRDSWVTTLKSITDCSTIDDVKVVKRGGRGCNYDFEVSVNGGKSYKVEFKFGAKSITSLPQFLSPNLSEGFLDGYPSYFYNNYVVKEEPWKSCGVPISEEVYLKEVQASSSKHPFFAKLYEIEESHPEKYKEQSELVKNSISEWLTSNYTKLDIEAVSDKFVLSQSEKIYVLWHVDRFYTETISNDDLKVDTVVGLTKKNNSILVNSASKKLQYKMLLRWKNHQGTLYPAWQISMKRL